MPYLLDTCTVSELGDPKPNLRVRDALLALPREDLFLSTITIAEIIFGIEMLTPSPKRSHLLAWFQQSIAGVFMDRILPVDFNVACRWGELMARLTGNGKLMQRADSYIAATALQHGLTLITRNESDFSASGVAILNPWT